MSARRHAATALQLLTPLLVGGVGGVLLASWFGPRSPDPSTAQSIALLALLLVVIVAALAVHEAGHLLGGALVGFQALLFVVGPLRLQRRGAGWAVELNRNVGLFGGLAASAPRDTHDLRRRMTVMAAGGPAGSILAGLLALAAYRFFGAGAGAPDMAGATMLPLVLGGFGVLSLGLGVVTIVPGRTSGFYTDGARVLRLLRGGHEAEAEVAIHALTALAMGGQRPREWDPTLVERALRLSPDTLFGVVARQSAFSHALDLGQADAAATHLEEALAHRGMLPRAVRPMLLAEAAWFLAEHGSEPGRARALLSESRGKPLFNRPQRLLAEAAVARLEGDEERARERLRAARSELRRALDTGMRILEEERVARLEARLAAGAPAAQRARPGVVGA